MNIPVGRIVRPLLSLLLCASLIGSGSFSAWAISPGELLINRLQISGGPGKTDNDFVELYNASSAAIDLNGLRLVKRSKNGASDTTIKSWTSPILILPGTVYLWANSADGFAASLNADTSSTQTLANDNGIALRQGPEDSGEIIDAIGWGAAQNNLYETAPFPENPGPDEILQRKEHQDRNNNMYDFELLKPFIATACGNSVIEGDESCDDGNTLDHDGCSASCALEAAPTVCGNGVLEMGEECDDGNTYPYDTCSGTCELMPGTPPAPPAASAGQIDIYINEFIVDPVAGGNEWIELYSPSLTAYSISGWTLEDGSGTKTKPQGTIGGNDHYFAIQKSAGALNNSGDIIILRDASGAIAHSVAYGDWDDGNVADNAPTASDPYSIARRPEADPAHSDRDNYTPTSMLTMWGVNIITPPPAVPPTSEDEDPDYDFSTAIRLSEIAPNPYGIDETARDNEFIELYNAGAQAVRLQGWRLEIGDKQYIYEFPADAVLGARQYLALRANGRFRLANSGASVKLFQPGKASAYQSATYKEALEGQSWALWQETAAGNSKTWKWTYLPTPAQANIFVSPPAASFSTIGALEAGEHIIFDSSDTDASGDVAEYLWNFGDGTSSNLASPEHAYASSGSYTVVLSVRNAYGASTVSRKISIAQSGAEQSIANLAKTKDPSLSSASGIEADYGQSLSSAEPSPYALTLNEIMPNPDGADSGQEWVEIVNNGKEAVDLSGWSIANKTKAGPPLADALSLEAGELFVFSADQLPPSLGNSQDTIRLLDAEGREAERIGYASAPSGQSYARLNEAWHWTTAVTPGEDNILEVPEAKASRSAAPQKTTARQTLTGSVAALPGVFGSQYFYLLPDGSPILQQVYNSKKLFPDLKIGQKISISGEASVTAAGPRFKTSTADDIRILTTATALPELPVSSSADLKNPPFPRLARIQGEVTSKKSPRLIVTDEHGDSEIYLTKGSGLSVTSFALGDQVMVQGVLQADGARVRLMPRIESDIELQNAPEGPQNTAQASELQEAYSQTARDPKQKAFPYLILIIIGITAAGAFAVWKYYPRKK